MSVRAYTLSAIAVTASAVAGLWFGALIAHGKPGAEAVRPPTPAIVDGVRVTSATPVPRF